MRGKTCQNSETSINNPTISEEEFDPSSAFVHMAVRNQKETDKLGIGNAYQFQNGLLFGCTNNNGSSNGQSSSNSSFNSSPSILSFSHDSSGLGPGGSTYNLFHHNVESLPPECLQGAQQNAMRGNQHFVMKHYKEAIQYFTEAIKLDPVDVRFFGNRSLCFLMLKEYERALDDALTAVSLEPTWAKGHFRKGSALEALSRFEEAEMAYDFAMKYSNESCPEAADAKRRVMVAQLVRMGFSPEQSTAAIFQYQSVKKASETLLKCNLGCKSTLKEVFDSDDEEALESGKWGPKSIRPASNGSAHSSTSTGKSSLSTGKPSGNRQKKTPSPPSHELKAGDPLVDPRNPLHCDTLWIGNLVKTCTEKTVNTIFSRFGKLKQSNMMLDKHCAFISYYDWKQAGEAMGELQGKEINGQKVLIKYPDRAVGSNKAGPHANLVLRKSNPQK